MRSEIDPTLRCLGEGLQKAGEATVQKPLPWRFLELLCQLDEKEVDMTRAHDGYEAAYRRMSHDQRRACDSHSQGRA